MDIYYLDNREELPIPPYSIKWEGKSNPLNINDPRFSPAGVLAPPSKADLAFTMHMLSWLSTEGTAAIVEFPGVLYRGGAEGKIRDYLVRNNFVDAVIQLPADLFFGTTIAICVLVLKRSKATSDILFVDASNEFVRSDAKNKLMPANIDRIARAVVERAEEELGGEKRTDYGKATVKKLSEELTAEYGKRCNRRRGAKMSRIDELIERLCPDGVQYNNLGNATQIVRGKRVVRKNLDEHDGYPVYQNSLKPLGFYGEANRPGGTTFVTCAGAAGDVGYSSEDFWSADDCFCPESNDVVNGRYLYHVIMSMQPRLKAQVRKASIPRLSPKAIENLRIPVPPMEVQQEIVRVLDSFAELEAELEARRKQYAYYRDKLLSFKEKVA